MTFGESALSSSIGAFAGFLGALIIFFLKEWRTNSVRRKSIIENLKLELQYNINLYEKSASDVQECIDAISNDSRNVYLTLNYGFVARTFAVQFYNEGLLLKYVHSEDMRRWNSILSQVSENSDEFVTECVAQWRQSKISKEDVYRALKLEKDHINEAKGMSEYILVRL